MTKQTSSQVNKTYRARRNAKLQRLAAYEAALREIASYEWTNSGSDIEQVRYDGLAEAGDIARQALEQGEGK